MKKIIVTGGSGRFGNYLKKVKSKHKFFFPTKNQLDILKLTSIRNYINKVKPDILIHLAGLSRPMSLHEKNIIKSIDLNIIGTSNITKICSQLNIKLIYFSTNYVYPGTKGNYKESGSLLPVNNYAWSKLGGEAAVQLYKKSLILRLCMTDYPFTHKKAIKGAKSSFIYNKTVSKLMPFLLNEFGVMNIGGKKREIYDFAKKFTDKKISSINLKKIKNFPKDSSINIEKLLNLLKKNHINLKKIIF